MEMQGAARSDLMVAGRVVPVSIVHLLTFLWRWSILVHHCSIQKMRRILMPGSSVLLGFFLVLGSATLSLPEEAAGSLRQESFLVEQGGKTEETYRHLFDVIETSLNNGNISSLTPHMAPQVHINVRGGESGYYSASQAYYLLENYFRSRKVLGFEFSTIGESDSNPYATGGASLNFKGSREYVQIYVSLRRSGRQWLITQINIY